jgi:hypothetical protein
MRTAKGKKRIQSGDWYYGGSDIQGDRERISQEENLKDELGLFRLASAHKDLGLEGRDSNYVLANIRIKFCTNTDVEVEHVIPIAVTKEGSAEVQTYYCGSYLDVDSQKFKELYQAVRPEIQTIDRRSHYHSEPFLTYYLTSEPGKNYLVSEFHMKGLTVVNEDATHLKTNIRDVLEIGIDMHSSRVVCFNCAPFLQSATPKILDAVYWAMALGNKPASERLVDIKFNVSANTNFDHANISRGKNFDHIPISDVESEVEEGLKVSVLSNTEKELGKSKVDLQKVGEIAKRTIFASGSSYPGGKDHDDIIAADKEQWAKLTNEAATKIQEAWKEYKLGQTAKTSAAVGDEDILSSEVAKMSLGKPSSKPKKSEDAKALQTSEEIVAGK